MGEPFLGRDARGPPFARAVELVDLGRRQRLHDPPLHRYWTRCRRVHDEAQAGDVVGRALLVGHLEDADEMRGHQERPGGAVHVDQTQPLARVPRRQEHGGGADVERGRCPAAVGRVVRRARHHIDVVGCPRPEGDLPVLAGAGHLAREATMDHALGPRRRARGVEDERRRSSALEPLHVVTVIAACGEQGLVLGPGHQGPAAGSLRPGRLDGGEQRRRGDDDARPRVGEHVAQLLRLQVPVDGQERRLQLRRGGRDVEELEAVRQHHRHRAVLARAEAAEGVRQTVGAIIELRVGAHAIPQHERRLVRGLDRMARDAAGLD